MATFCKMQPIHYEAFKQYVIIRSLQNLHRIVNSNCDSLSRPSFGTAIFPLFLMSYHGKLGAFRRLRLTPSPPLLLERGNEINGKNNKQSYNGNFHFLRHYKKLKKIFFIAMSHDSGRCVKSVTLFSTGGFLQKQ